MSDAKAAWEQVGSTFSGLGMKLRLHFEQARGEESGAATPEGSGSPAAGSSAPGAGSAGEHATGPAYAPPTEPGGGTAAAESTASGGGAREEAREALRKLGAAIDDAFEALGAAAKDPSVKEDLKQVGQSLTSALSATFADVSDDLRRAFRRNKGDDAGGGSAGGGTASS